MSASQKATRTRLPRDSMSTFSAMFTLAVNPGALSNFVRLGLLPAPEDFDDLHANIFDGRPVHRRYKLWKRADIVRLKQTRPEALLRAQEACRWTRGRLRKAADAAKTAGSLH